MAKFEIFLEPAKNEECSLPSVIDKGDKPNSAPHAAHMQLYCVSITGSEGTAMGSFEFV